MNARVIIEQLDTDTQSQSQRKICLQILRFMEQLSSDELRMLTFRSFLNASHKELLDADLIGAITLLVGLKKPALEAKIMFIDSNNEEFELDKDELKLAQQSGRLVHPESGELVDNFEQHLFPFFVATQFFLDEK